MFNTHSPHRIQVSCVSPLLLCAFSGLAWYTLVQTLIQVSPMAILSSVTTSLVPLARQLPPPGRVCRWLCSVLTGGVLQAKRLVCYLSINQLCQGACYFPCSCSLRASPFITGVLVLCLSLWAQTVSPVQLHVCPHASAVTIFDCPFVLQE